MIRTVMLDFDNTLHDSDSKFTVGLNGLFGMEGGTLYQTFIVKIHRGIIHKRYPERHEDLNFQSTLLIEYLGKSVDDDLVGEFVSRYERAERECWTNPAYFEEALPFLDKVKSGGFKVVLTTGPHAEEKARGIERFTGREYFDYVFGEVDLGYPKTDPNYFRKALEISKSHSGETASIGDTPTHDIAPAKAVGIKTIWLNRKNEKILAEIKPDYEASNLLEAYDLLQGLVER